MPALALAGVHAPVGKLQGVRGRRGLLGQQTCRTSVDLEALAALGERGRAGREQRVDARPGPADQRAELVAAQPVGAARPGDGVGEPRGQPHEQLVAGGVAEGVVVLLEAVEVEEEQRARRPRLASASCSSRSASRLRRFFSPVSESRARLGVGLRRACAGSRGTRVPSAPGPAAAPTRRGSRRPRSRARSGRRRAAATATSPHPTGTAMISQSWSAIFFAPAARRPAPQGTRTRARRSRAACPRRSRPWRSGRDRCRPPPR